MASSESPVETAPLSHTPDPAPDLHIEAPEPEITIAVLEMSSPSPSCWDSLSPPKNTSDHVAGLLTTQKLQDLLRDLKDVLKNVADLGVTEEKESSEETEISKDGSEPRETAGGLDKADEAVSKNLLIRLDLEDKQGAKKQGLTLERQSPKDTGHLSATVWEKHSEGRKAPPKAPQSKKEEEGSPGVREEHAELRGSMEQLLQEVEHWSQQHTELSELIKSYQRSQRDGGAAVDGHWAQLQSQSHSHVCARHALEAVVRRLNQDTHSLHLVVALLENECQILHQKVQTLGESRQPWEGTSLEKPLQRNQQGKNSQMPLEAEGVESSSPSLGGAFPKKGWVYRSSDPCLNKKAQDNQFNTRLARALVGRQRPASSFR
ncbi:spermatogenic leucine zipper protein 1 [Erethizon dorsatum]